MSKSIGRAGALIAATVVAAACGNSERMTTPTAAEQTRAVMVSGTVADVDGAPLAGAVVLGTAGTTTRTSLAGSDGRFSLGPFTLAPGGSVLVTAGLSGYVTASSTVAAAAADPTTSITLFREGTADNLSIASFDLGAYQVNGSLFIYYPTVTLQETSGARSATLTSIEFREVPGNGRTIISAAGCVLHPTIKAGNAWDMSDVRSYCRDVDVPALLTTLEVTVRFYDSAGRTGTITATTSCSSCAAAGGTVTTAPEARRTVAGSPTGDRPDSPR